MCTGLAVVVFCLVVLVVDKGLPNELKGFFFYVQVPQIMDYCHVQISYRACMHTSCIFAMHIIVVHTLFSKSHIIAN